MTAGAIYGSIYKVTAPTIYAPYACLGILVIGVIVAFFRVGDGGSYAKASSSETAKTAS